jgi:hypothetical protein
MRLFGTWFSALPEYHRVAPALLLRSFDLNEGAGQIVAEANAVLAAATVTGAAAAVIRDVMRRSASRWQACRVAMICALQLAFPSSLLCLKLCRPNLWDFRKGFWRGQLLCFSKFARASPVRITIPKFRY